MPGSSRFAVAVHILTLMALERPKPQTSDRLAESANTNPAVIRRLLGALSQAGLTHSRLGKGGGSTLARGPKKISLLEIYEAVEEPGLLGMPRTAPDRACPVGRHIEDSLTGIAERAEQAFLERLSEVNLKQVAKEIAAANAAAKSAA